MAQGANSEFESAIAKPNWAPYHFALSSKADLAVTATEGSEGIKSTSNASFAVCARCNNPNVRKVSTALYSDLPRTLAVQKCPEIDLAPLKSLKKRTMFLVAVVTLAPLLFCFIPAFKHHMPITMVISFFFAFVPVALNLWLSSAEKEKDKQLRKAYQPVVDRHERRNAVRDRCYYCPDCNSVTDPVTGKHVPAVSFSLLLPR